MELPSSSSPSHGAHNQPAAGLMPQPSLGPVVHRHPDAQHAPDPGDELSVSQPPQVVFSLSTLESGSLALE